MHAFSVYSSSTLAYVGISTRSQEDCRPRLGRYLFSCFDAKVTLNFGCLGCAWAIVKSSQMTPRSAGVVSKPWGREFLEGRYESDYQRRRNRKHPYIRWMSDALQSIVAVCFLPAVGGLSCAKVALVCDVCVCESIPAPRYMLPPLRKLRGEVR